MAVIIDTDTPKKLLRLIREAIDEGTVRTWIVDDDGDFTHTSDQWGKRAWLRPLPQEGRLVMNIRPTKTRAVSTYVYAVYHSEMIQMVLAHFDKHFRRAIASAMPTAGDITGDGE